MSGNLDIVIGKPDTLFVRDALAQGWPVLLGLALTAGEAPAGAQFVVATGIASDGGIQIQDPNPALARANLNDYLVGFAAAGQNWRGTLTAALLFPAAGSESWRFPGFR